MAHEIVVAMDNSCARTASPSTLRKRAERSAELTPLSTNDTSDAQLLCAQLNVEAEATGLNNLALPSLFVRDYAATARLQQAICFHIAQDGVLRCPVGQHLAL